MLLECKGVQEHLRLGSIRLSDAVKFCQTEFSNDWDKQLQDFEQYYQRMLTNYDSLKDKMDSELFSRNLNNLDAIIGDFTEEKSVWKTLREKFMELR